MAERQHSNISIVLLDWEKAFDKVSQSKLLQVLRRIKAPPKMLKLVEQMYEDPQFRIRAEGNFSANRRQHSGIRQGCPLSPYLFTILMSAMFRDIKTKLNTPKQQEPIQGMRFAEILYADDTLVFGTHTHTINKLLHEIQSASDYYNMRLNYDKCINLTLNQKQSSIKYIDGTPVPRKHHATYFRTLLTDDVNNHREVQNRIADARSTCNRLKLFWNKAQNTIQWKIRVFESILKSKILYGLECIQLTASDVSKINSFQMKGIRRILKIPPPHIDRTYTNQKVLDILRTTYQKDTEKFSTTWKKRKVKLLGHILRTNHNDPMRQVIFEPYTFATRHEYRRPGKPRASWLQETFKDAFSAIGETGKL